MKALLAIVAVLMAVPAAAQDQGGNAFQAGVEARRNGHHEEAERLLRGWLAKHPEDVDARVQLAYAELALGNLDGAEADFTAVLAQAPSYKDARDGLALIVARRGSPESGSPPTLAIEGSWSDLNHRASDWYETGARLTMPAGDRVTLDGAGTYYRRFGLDDFELAGTVTIKQGENLWLRAQASVTPGADFRPRWGAGAGFDWRLKAGPTATVLTTDVKYEEFPAQHVTTLVPGLMQYFADGRAWLTVRGFVVIPQGQAVQVGGMWRADFEPVERHRFFVGVADGPDTDLGVVTNVTSIFGGVEVPLGQRFTLTTSLTREWREIGADRTELRVGLKAGL